MRIDINHHAQGLLEFLGQDDENEVEEYFDENEINIANGLMVVRYLVDNGWAKDLSTMGGPDCMLTGIGLALAQKSLAELRSPARRLGTL